MKIGCDFGKDITYDCVINQMGGYDEAKNYLKKLEEIPLHEQTEDTITWLPRCLLQYRRANNIFETGDRIIYPWIGNEICTYNSECIVKTPCIHATDAEVLAGHRLPSIESLNDKDTQPNTIVLER